MQSGGAEEVESGDGVRYKAVPEVQWEIRVHARDSRDEMTLESVNGLLSVVRAVIVG